MVENRYIKNLNSISEENMDALKKSKVCIVGCGGLGGFIIEILARIGVGNLVLVDGDTFNETNLNRQLMSTEKNIGKSKVEEAALRVGQINSEVKVTTYNTFFDKNNGSEILDGCDLAIDALDNVESRLVLELACEEYGIDLVHGAIGGWYGHLAVIKPGSRLLEKLYSNADSEGNENTLGNPTFTPAVLASLQSAEAIKLLIGKESQLENNMLSIDLLNSDFEIIELN